MSDTEECPALERFDRAYENRGQSPVVLLLYSLPTAHSTPRATKSR